MRPSHIVSALALALAGGFPALADEAKDGKAASLPGVTGDYSIVAPAPEPMDEPRDGATTFKAGNWDVTVSGYVSAQVGASSHGDGR